MNERSFIMAATRSPDLRERIRDAAIRVFSNDGFHRARMTSIAQEAGVAVGTIYNYYKSKDDLLISVFEDGLQERMGFLEEMGNTSLPLRDQIQYLLESHFTQMKSKRELAELILYERFHRGSRLQGRILELQRKIIDRIAEILEAGITAGWLRPCNPAVVAQALFDLVQTMTACQVFSSDTEDDVLAAAPKELADLMWRGLRHDTGADDE